MKNLIAPSSNKEVKIVSWKYDDVYNAFLIKRVNGLCDVFYQYIDMLKLPVQDIKELIKIPLVNHTKHHRREFFEEQLKKSYFQNKSAFEALARKQDKIFFA